jgi:hypothetical protein
MNQNINLHRLTLFFCSISLLFIAGCITKPSTISFEVKAPGITDGVFIIKGDKGEVLYGGSIKNGNLKLAYQPIEQTGYFTLNISNRAKTTTPMPFEVYLEPGNYTIETNAQSMRDYPKITSTSAIQNELTAYYSAISGNKKVQRPDEVEKRVLKDFVNKNPNSVTAAHLMLHLAYEEDPATYYAIYKKMSEETRNSYEGKEVGERLTQLIKLFPGQPAPLISGKTPEGKEFKVADLNKKIYLVEFWKSGNELSRMNHSEADLKNMLNGIPKNKNMGMIGISLDTKRDWWTSAVTDDKVTYPQYADLKGNESANAVNWGIARIPTYYLVDGNWKILDKDISLHEAVVVINQYLDHH